MMLTVESGALVSSQPGFVFNLAVRGMEITRDAVVGAKFVGSLAVIEVGI
jgi:hypothetical protein